MPYRRKKLTFAISSPDEFLYYFGAVAQRVERCMGLPSTGRGFISYSGQKLRNNLGQVVHT